MNIDFTNSFKTYYASFFFANIFEEKPSIVKHLFIILILLSLPLKQYFVFLLCHYMYRFHFVVAPICVACGEVFSQRKVVIVGSLIGFVMVGLSSLLVSIEYFVFFYGVGTGNVNTEGKYDKKMNLTKNGAHDYLYMYYSIYTYIQ